VFLSRRFFKKFFHFFCFVFLFLCVGVEENAKGLSSTKRNFSYLGRRRLLGTDGPADVERRMQIAAH
jgi:hypothetical protein